MAPAEDIARRTGELAKSAPAVESAERAAEVLLEFPKTCRRLRWEAAQLRVLLKRGDWRAELPGRDEIGPSPWVVDDGP